MKSAFGSHFMLLLVTVIAFAIVTDLFDGAHAFG
jgi:hypothetical protein